MCVFFVDNLMEGFFQTYKNSLRKESLTLNKNIGKWQKRIKSKYFPAFNKSIKNKNIQKIQIIIHKL